MNEANDESDNIAKFHPPALVDLVRDSTLFDDFYNSVMSEVFRKKALELHNLIVSEIPPEKRVKGQHE